MMECGTRAVADVCHNPNGIKRVSRFVSGIEIEHPERYQLAEK